MTQYSLRKVLLRWLLASFGVCIVVLLPIAYSVLNNRADAAYDQALTDGALALVPYLTVVEQRAHFDFPQAAEKYLRSDRFDKIYYLVQGPQRQFIAGDRELASVERRDLRDLRDLHRPNTEPLLYDALFHGKPIRVSTIQLIADQERYTFSMAETTHKREQIAVGLRIALFVPVLILVLVIAITIWFAVRQAIAPIDTIRASLQNMQDRNLAPLDENLAPLEIRPLVHEFNALLNRLDASSEAQQRFVANAAHQLRTPLAGVRTQLELMNAESEAEVRVKRVEQSIVAISRLGHLINQLLTLLSAAPGAREVFQRAHVDIANIIRDRSSEWVRWALPRNIDLGFELQSVRLMGDGLMIGEMIANLVDNAIRFTPNEGVVTVRCVVCEGQAVIEVEDNGPGIPVAERERVFERFFRLPGTEAQGSGLGLAIVAEVAKGMGGNVKILAGTNEVGCLVQIHLPLGR